MFKKLKKYRDKAREVKKDLQKKRKEYVSKDGIDFKQWGKDLREARKELKDNTYVAENTRPFIFSGIKDNEKLSSSENIDAPFPLFSIELAGNKPLFENNMGSWLCILVKEIAPKEYSLFSHVKPKDKNRSARVIEVNSRLHKADFEIMLPILNQYLDEIKNQKVGIAEGSPIRLKNPNNPKKKISIPKDYVFIVSPKNSYQNSFPGMKIDWSHRWEVRGHWRSIKGIGVDRDGNRCISGFTWIKPYKKGPEEAPLIKKQRIITSCSDDKPGRS